MNRHKIDLIFLSSLKRSQATTELLVKEKKCSILHSKHFLERNFGLVEGLVFNEIDAKCNKKRKLLLRTRNPKYSPKGGESLKDVEKRVLMFLRKQAFLNNVVFMTHGGFLDVLYEMLRQIPLNTKKVGKFPT